MAENDDTSESSEEHDAESSFFDPKMATELDKALDLEVCTVVAQEQVKKLALETKIEQLNLQLQVVTMNTYWI